VSVWGGEHQGQRTDPAPRVGDARDADVIGRPPQAAPAQQRRHVRHVRQPPPPLVPRELPHRVGAESRVVPCAPYESGRHRRLVDRRRPAGSRRGAASVSGPRRTRSAAGGSLCLLIAIPAGLRAVKG